MAEGNARDGRHWAVAAVLHYLNERGLICDHGNASFRLASPL